MSKDMTKLVLQLSDLHLFKTAQETMMKVNPAIALEKVITQICADCADNFPDLAVISGDLSQDGSLESYCLASDLLKRLAIPCFALSGNHDEEKHLKRIFSTPEQTVIPFSSTTWTLLGLNTQVKGATHGMIRNEEWQAVTTLIKSQPERNFALFMHHHLLPCGSSWLDKINVHNAKLLLNFIKTHPNLRAVFMGHIHQELAERYGSTRFYATPAIGWQFAVHRQKFKLDDTMPGYRLIRFFEDGHVETSVRRIPFDAQFAPDHTVTGY